jgi:23S rRNA (guanine2445-N2)-methyltransferase / 23S rRNA (guanine2069-N7)-methyltransferase
VGLSLFATVPAGMESMLAGELRGLGADDVRQTRAGVAFAGSLETAYRACLWSRLASRVLLVLATGPAGDADALYDSVRRVAWADHLDADGTLAVDFTGASPAIRDTRFGAVRVKDAIVDQFREASGARPSVDVRAPDVRVNAHLARGRVTLSIDLSGDSLHRRGYRAERAHVDAPLKETLAAAILLFAAWPQEAAAGGSFVDPLCGSGTLPIEGAWIAADIAPGLLRAESGEKPGAAARGFGFTRWKAHDAAVWGAVVNEARERRAAGLDRLKSVTPSVVIRGSDHDARAVTVARACVARAGLAGVVAVAHDDLTGTRPPSPSGLFAANAPYGERLGDADAAMAVCRLLGRRLRDVFSGWRAAVLTGDRAQAAAIGLRPVRETTLRNGALDCVLTYVDVDAPSPERTPGEAARSSPEARRTAPGAPGAAEQLTNRLRRNVRHIGRTMRRQGITCYRLYDADLPEYNLAVDLYDGRVHVQEYAPPPEIDQDRAAAHLAEAVDVLADVLEVRRGDIVVKQRRRMRGAAQYQRRAASGATLPVSEDGLTYLVDLELYLDTGLFLDQRETRRLIRRLAGGRRFLNLFAYTSTATVCAIAGGAPATTSVDLSATYLDWSRRNLLENGVTGVQVELARRAAPGERAGAAHRLVQADCLRWVAEAEGQYDLVFLDPPSFSNSKRMGGATFDVQRDHPDLIRMTVRRLLAPRGILLFSTNRRGFKLDPATLPSMTLKDLSHATLAPDFARRANAHHVWRIEAR